MNGLLNRIRVIDATTAPIRIIVIVQVWPDTPQPVHPTLTKKAVTLAIVAMHIHPKYIPKAALEIEAGKS